MPAVGSNMLTYQMPTTKVFMSEEGLRFDRPAPGYQTHSTFGIGGRTALRPSQMRKFPLVLPLNSNQNENTLVSSLINKGKLNVNKEDKVISEDVDQGHDIFGKYFLSQTACTKLERTSTAVPSLRKDNNEYRHVKLHPLNLSAELPSIPSGRLFTVGQTFKSHYGGSKEPFVAPETQVADPRISEVNFTSPSTLILNGKNNNFSVESWKLSSQTFKSHYGGSKEPFVAPETQVADPRISEVNFSSPSTLILNGKNNNFSVESWKLSSQTFKSHYGGSKEPFVAPETQVADPRISEVNFSSPSTLILNGKNNNFSVESWKLSSQTFKSHYGGSKEPFVAPETQVADPRISEVNFTSPSTLILNGKNNNFSVESWKLSSQNFKSHYGGSKEPFAVPETQVADPRISEVNFTSPSTLILNGKNNFSVESWKLSRPKLHYTTYTSPVTVRNNQKSGLHIAQTYSDPVIGAPRSFMHRISELSSLEGETLRYEKVKKMRKSKKSPS